MKQPLITNIQKYAIHDGTGIRTTVFFKGCPLACLWCHNPETQRYAPTVLTYQERCVGCGACAAVCPKGAVCMEEAQEPEETVSAGIAGNAETEETAGGLSAQAQAKPAKTWRAVTDRERCAGCGLCTDECLQNARELCGRPWKIADLVKEIQKDTAFYETSGGGVTLSGGEVLAQDMDYIETLARTLHARGIRIFIDTCGAVPYEHFARVLPYTDTFLFDIKLLDEKKHTAYTGKSNRQILENLRRLSGQGAALWIRIPVIGGVNDDPEEIGAIGRFLRENQIKYQQVNLLPYHNTGSGKYGHLEREYEGKDFYVPDAKKMEQLKQTLEELGIGPILIGG